MARWIAETGARPAVVVVRHTSLVKLAPLLLDPETAGDVTRTRRVSDFAGTWRAAFDRGVPFLGAEDGDEPRYWVRFYVRNANAVTTFWFDVEHIDADGATGRVLTTARDRRVALDVVLAETAEEPPYEVWLRRIREAAAGGSARAKRALALVARASVWLLVIAAIAYVSFRALPAAAQQEIRRVLADTWRSLQHSVGIRSQSSIDVIAPRYPPPAAPRVVNYVDLGNYVVSLPPNPMPAIQASPLTAGIEAISLTGEEPEHVTLLVYPSPPLRTGKATIEFDFGDGSPRVENPISAENGWMTNHDHVFSRRRPADLGVAGDLAGPYIVTARVYQGIGARRRLVEVIKRTLLIHLPASSAPD